ncbi:MAG: hypothetical protein CEE41_05165 [Hadesarchaea archaeon B3_Hades]|nr:MAG: hypothetical protein CEE41_05165 [Hadesarchaea archaeon B3_Hades]
MVIGLPWLTLLPGKWHGKTWGSQVACFYAHPPRIVPPFVISPHPPEYWGAHYYSRAIPYDCGGNRLGSETIGQENIYGLPGYVFAAYAAAAIDVHETVPSFNTFIDLRSPGMMAAGCCPPMLLEEET